ncbi:MAG: hypothetical protein EZS28_027889 [Streblomastix strix]|uniref:Uncharacterized protein n=1 Tax=Streblomastix strix TaxID=222440 RepID=A0A5J4V295_9EUKA|nr:MAG: hypothetical protein EZS28_027889 [Streblomastix strix]
MGRGRKRRRVISSEGSGNGQNNEYWAEGLHREVERQQLKQFRIRRNRREQALPPVQTVTLAPVFMSSLRPAQEDAFRTAFPKRQVEIKVYAGEQVQYINKMEQNDKFQNMMSNMMNKLQHHCNEDEALRLRTDVLNRLFPEEQQRVKRCFGPQMRLTSFYESQIQRKLAESNSNAIHIDTSWDFGSGTREQQDEFQEDFIDEPQQLEIRLQNKKNQKHQRRKHQRRVQLSPWTIVQLDELSETAREGPRPVIHKNEIEITHQLKAKDIPKGTQHQQIAEEAAQVHHTLREIFPKKGNVRKVISSTDSIVSGQVGVAGTKPINIQTASSTQFQGNPIHEPKIQKKGGSTPVRNKATRANTSIVANQNQSEDQQR